MSLIVSYMIDPNNESLYVLSVMWHAVIGNECRENSYVATMQIKLAKGHRKCMAATGHYNEVKITLGSKGEGGSEFESLKLHYVPDCFVHD
jgi:hypothetical protein